MGPEIITQVATIIMAVWFSGRSVIKRLVRVEEKLDNLPCSNGGCTRKRPKFIVLKPSEKSK